MKPLTRALAAGVLALGLLPSLGCGAEPVKAAPAPKVDTPAWADVFERTPDAYVVLRPQALKHDGLYGAFWSSLVRLIQARGFARGATMVEAVEGASEILVGLNPGDATIVLRGVPASLDPQKITDAEGRALFRPVSDERARVTELEIADRAHAEAGGLFVLPDRTWIGVLGDTRARARQVFATPLHRPAPEVDPAALVVARFSGGFVRLFDRHPFYGPLAKKLTTATFALAPGKGGLALALAYGDADSAAFAEVQAKRILGELAKRPELGWLSSAKIGYEGTTVIVRVSVPPRLLEELPSVKASDLGL